MAAFLKLAFEDRIKSETNNPPMPNLNSKK